MLHLTRTTPSRDPFASLSDRFFGEEFFPGFFFRNAPATESTGQTGWSPRVDIQETEKGYLLHADLPGLTKADIDLTFEDGVLTLSGERTFQQEKDSGSFRRLERSFGSFTRSFRMPREIDAAKIKASFKNGVLTIDVAKADAALPQKIAVN